MFLQELIGEKTFIFIYTYIYIPTGFGTDWYTNRFFNDKFLSLKTCPNILKMKIWSVCIKFGPYILYC